MKKMLLTLFATLLTGTLLAGCSCALEDTDKNGDTGAGTGTENELPSGEEGGEETPPKEEQPNEFAIRYVGIDFETGKEITIPSGMWKADGSYPTEYTIGETVTIDLLENTANGGVEYTFLGYFSDRDCTTVFAGITQETTGEVVVFAQIKDDVTIYV